MNDEEHREYERLYQKNRHLLEGRTLEERAALLKKIQGELHRRKALREKYGDIPDTI